MSKRLQAAVDALARNVSKMQEHFALKLLFEQLSEICEASDKPIVLMIDEVDSAANNQVFVDFLAQLRAQYLNRFSQAAFWSVILAGVYDIRHLRQKLRPKEEHRMNSPWNIAAEFKVDLSFFQRGDCCNAARICQRSFCAHRHRWHGGAALGLYCGLPFFGL